MRMKPTNLGHIAQRLCILAMLLLPPGLRAVTITDQQTGVNEWTYNAYVFPSVVAWGYNGDGQTAVPRTLTNAVAIAAGYLHSLAVRADGSVAAWGINWAGQSTPPSSATNVVGLSAGDHTLALRADGTVVAWGYNVYGQANVPPGLSNVVAIAGGGNFSLSSGRAPTWC